MIYLENLYFYFAYAAITFKNFNKLLFKKSYLDSSFSYLCMTIMLCSVDSNRRENKIYIDNRF